MSKGGIDDLEDNSRSTLERGKPLTYEKEEMYLKGLPRVVQNYLRFECPVDLDVRAVYSMYRQLKSGDLVVEVLRHGLREDALKMYGGGFSDMTSLSLEWHRNEPVLITHGDDGQVVKTRAATIPEVLQMQNTAALEDLAQLLRVHIDEIRAVQTFGLRINK